MTVLQVMNKERLSVVPWSNLTIIVNNITFCILKRQKILKMV